MSSTYSSSLRIELIGSGEQAGAWGVTTDNNFAYVFDTAIAGYQAVPITSTSQALTYVNGATATANLNQSVYAMLKFTGASAATSVYIPPVSKQYIVYNNSGYAITIYNSTVIGNTTAAGTGITVANGDKILVWSEGTNVLDVKSSGITGTLPTSQITGTVAIANGGTGQTTAVAAFNALSTNAVYIDGSSNVGIGTSSPATEGTNVRTAIVGTAGQQASSLATSNSNAGFTVRGNSSSGYQLAIGATNNGSIPYIQGVNYNGGAASADLAIQAYGGNVGIGTSSPGAKLDIAANALPAAVAVTTNSNGSLPAVSAGLVISQNYTGGTAGAAEIDFFFNSPTFLGDSGGFRFYQRTGATTVNEMMRMTQNAVITYTGGTERMRITSAGGLAVGTTSDPGAGSIYATGNITAYFSDDRLKTRFGNIQNALDKVKSLDGFYYEANQTAQDLGYKPVREAGVSAQQVQAILPEVVKPAPIDQQYLTVDYERLVPLLIEAIKELNGKVEILEAKLKEV